MSTTLHTQKIEPSLFKARADTLLAWLGMAGALINTRGTILLIDPLITMVERDGAEVCESGHRLKVPLPIEARELPRVDAVLYTHADGDHLGRATVEILNARLQPLFVAPPPVERVLRELGVPPERCVTAQDFMTLRIGEAEVEVTPALHDWQKQNPWQRGDCCGFLVKTPDGVIWHPGDTRLIDELGAIRGVDVLFFDVAAVNAHLGPSGSARLAATCGAKALIAYHYGTFDLPPGTFATCDPADALPFLEGLAADFLRLNPGEPLHLPLPQPERQNA